MAGRGASAMTKQAYRLFNPRTSLAELTGLVQDEFDESDIWGTSVQLTPATPARVIPTGRFGNRKPDKIGNQTGPCSLPVNIPDWSKILGEKHGCDNGSVDNYQFWDEKVDRTGQFVQPHEFLSMNRTYPTSSVEEGIGRTLKG